MAALRIALVSSEVAPYAKTGGLADVVGALARALHRGGHDVRVFLPLYGSLREGREELVAVKGLHSLSLEYPDRTVTLAVKKATLPDSDRADGTSLDIEFLDCPELYHRDGYYTSDDDEPLRWASLCRGAIEACQHTGWAPDVIHCNDWHTGLLPLYLRSWYGWDELFKDTRTLLSIHNIGYQGQFPADAIGALGLTDAKEMFHQEHLADGYIGFLETGLVYATYLSTVSETYAREIQDEEHGLGLHELLRAREDHLIGIVNGVDVGEWSPDTDKLIPHAFDAKDLSGKELCKKELLAEFDLAPGADVPVIGIVSRMTGQKGFELLPDILPVLLQRSDLRLVVLGSGEERYERYFQWLRDTMPDKVAVYSGYNNDLAHRIEAGSDLFLMPSRYEPCGLNQMYSLRYGTVPIVRSTGGLADTVERWDPETQAGTGFVFYEFTPEALFETLVHALDVWRDRAAWRKLMQNGMAQDFSWERQSAHYVDLYNKMLDE